MRTPHLVSTSRDGRLAQVFVLVTFGATAMTLGGGTAWNLLTAPQPSSRIIGHALIVRLAADGSPADPRGAGDGRGAGAGTTAGDGPGDSHATPPGRPQGDAQVDPRDGALPGAGPDDVRPAPRLGVPWSTAAEAGGSIPGPAGAGWPGTSGAGAGAGAAAPTGSSAGPTAAGPAPSTAAPAWPTSAPWSTSSTRTLHTVTPTRVSTLTDDDHEDHDSSRTTRSSSSEHDD